LPILAAAIWAASTLFASAQPATPAELQKASDAIQQWGLTGKWYADCRRGALCS
jgi:uncharacterized membrane protein